MRNYHKFAIIKIILFCLAILALTNLTGCYSVTEIMPHSIDKQYYNALGEPLYTEAQVNAIVENKVNVILTQQQISKPPENFFPGFEQHRSKVVWFASLILAIICLFLLAKRKKSPKKTKITF